MRIAQQTKKSSIPRVMPSDHSSLCPPDGFEHQQLCANLKGQIKVYSAIKFLARFRTA